MAEKQKKSPAGAWLDIAANRIRFKPDRKAVRAELSAHLEDKALDLQRIYPDLTEEEAQQRAAAEMGDPEEVGRELAKIHKPWLGYAWIASRVLLDLSIGAAVFLLAAGVYRSGWENLRHLAHGPSSYYGEALSPVEETYQDNASLTYLGALADSGPVRAGAYTFSTHHGELWTVTLEGQPHQVVYLQLEVCHLRPLESLHRRTVNEFWAEDDQGGVLLSSGDRWRQNQAPGNLSCTVWHTALDYGAFTDRYEMMMALPNLEAKRVDLRYTHPGSDLTIPISLEVTKP